MDTCGKMKASWSDIMQRHHDIIFIWLALSVSPMSIVPTEFWFDCFLENLLRRICNQCLRAFERHPFQVWTQSKHWSITVWIGHFDNADQDWGVYWDPRRSWVISLSIVGQWSAGLQSVQVLLSTQNLTVHQHGEHQSQDLTRREEQEEEEEVFRSNTMIPCQRRNTSSWNEAATQSFSWILTSSCSCLNHQSTLSEITDRQ